MYITRKTEKTIDKRAYTEISNDEIIFIIKYL